MSRRRLELPESDDPAERRNWRMVRIERLETEARELKLDGALAALADARQVVDSGEFTLFLDEAKRAVMAARHRQEAIRALTLSKHMSSIAQGDRLSARDPIRARIVTAMRNARVAGTDFYNFMANWEGSAAEELEVRLIAGSEPPTYSILDVSDDSDDKPKRYRDSTLKTMFYGDAKPPAGVTVSKKR